jgi:hypothetical protein
MSDTSEARAVRHRAQDERRLLAFEALHHFTDEPGLHGDQLSLGAEPSKYLVWFGRELLRDERVRCAGAERVLDALDKADDSFAAVVQPTQVGPGRPAMQVFINFAHSLVDRVCVAGVKLGLPQRVHRCRQREQAEAE